MIKARTAPEKYIAMVERMESRPNTWIKINAYGTKGSAYVAALNIRKGDNRSFLAFRGRGGQFETKIRGEAEVWARFVGKPAKTKGKKK